MDEVEPASAQPEAHHQAPGLIANGCYESWSYPEDTIWEKRMKRIAIVVGIGFTAWGVAALLYRVATSFSVLPYVSAIVWWASLALVLGIGIVAVRRWRWW
jgi:hypothetical protein